MTSRMYTNHAHGAMHKSSHTIEREKSPWVSKVKSLCSLEFAVGVVAIRHLSYLILEPVSLRLESLNFLTGS